MQNYFSQRKQDVYPDEFFTALPKIKLKDLEEVEPLDGFSVYFYQFGKLNMVGQELPKPKRSGRGGAVMPLVELRSPIQSLIG